MKLSKQLKNKKFARASAIIALMLLNSCASNPINKAGGDDARHPASEMKSKNPYRIMLQEMEDNCWMGVYDEDKEGNDIAPKGWHFSCAQKLSTVVSNFDEIANFYLGGVARYEAYLRHIKVGILDKPDSPEKEAILSSLPALDAEVPLYVRAYTLPMLKYLNDYKKGPEVRQKLINMIAQVRKVEAINQEKLDTIKDEQDRHEFAYEALQSMGEMKVQPGPTNEEQTFFEFFRESNMAFTGMHDDLNLDGKLKDSSLFKYATVSLFPKSDEIIGGKDFNSYCYKDQSSNFVGNKMKLGDKGASPVWFYLNYSESNNKDDGINVTRYALFDKIFHPLNDYEELASYLRAYREKKIKYSYNRLRLFGGKDLEVSFNKDNMTINIPYKRGRNLKWGGLDLFGSIFNNKPIGLYSVDYCDSKQEDIKAIVEDIISK